MKRSQFLAFTGLSTTLMTALLAVPLFYTIWWSFQRVSYGQSGVWIGLRNYTHTLSNPRFLADLAFTVVFALVVTALLVVLGYLLATLLFSAKRLRTLFLGLLLVPYVVPVVVGALAFAWLFNDSYGGPVSGLLRGLGLHVDWLAQTGPARILLVLNTVWNQAAFPTLILLAGLHTVPLEHLEAASMDGANLGQRQRFIVIPHLRRMFVLIASISIMDNLRIFDQVQVITPSAVTLGTESIMSYTYNVALGENTQLGVASAVSVITMILTFTILFPLLRQNYQDLTRP